MTVRGRRVDEAHRPDIAVVRTTANGPASPRCGRCRKTAKTAVGAVVHGDAAAPPTAGIAVVAIPPLRLETPRAAQRPGRHPDRAPGTAAVAVVAVGTAGLAIAAVGRDRAVELKHTRHDHADCAATVAAPALVTAAERTRTGRSRRCRLEDVAIGRAAAGATAAGTAAPPVAAPTRVARDRNTAARPVAGATIQPRVPPAVGRHDRVARHRDAAGRDAAACASPLASDLGGSVLPPDRESGGARQRQAVRHRQPRAPRQVR